MLSLDNIKGLPHYQQQVSTSHMNPFVRETIPRILYEYIQFKSTLCIWTCLVH